jgi:pleiotropic regulator 1
VSIIFYIYRSEIVNLSRLSDVAHSNQKASSTSNSNSNSHIAQKLPSLLSQSLIRRVEARSVKPNYHPQWKLLRVISGHLGWVRAVAVEPGNQWFATGAGDRIIKVSKNNLVSLR